MKISTDIFASPIRALRRRLEQIEGRKISQEEMARRIGCTLAGYRKWESGTVPSGEWMLKLLALCPDEETWNAFADALGIDAPRQLLPPKADVELARYFNDAVEGLKLLYEAAAAGSPGARETLRAEADRLIDRAAHWRDAQAAREAKEKRKEK